MEPLSRESQLISILRDILYKNRDEVISIENILLCMQAIVNHKDTNVEDSLWNTGLL